MKTKVLFVWEDGHVLAVFPAVKWDRVGNLTCYGHVSQHGPISQEYFSECEVVQNPVDYLQLQKELQNIGYVLDVINKKESTSLTNTVKTR
jgi:hypothetical protein